MNIERVSVTRNISSNWSALGTTIGYGSLLLGPKFIFNPPNKLDH